MLKNIPAVLSPELFKIMMEMGHGDTIVLADGNFPAASCAQRLVRADGLDVPTLLAAILQFFPLDTYVASPVQLMQVVPGDTVQTPIWDTFHALCAGYAIGEIERNAFYKEAKQAYAIVATSEKALYANIILTKGVC